MYSKEIQSPYKTSKIGALMEEHGMAFVQEGHKK